MPPPQNTTEASAHAPAATLENPNGQAAILLLCDHASAYMPPELDHLGLAPQDRLKHVAWDIGALGVARLLAKAFDAPLARSGYSRLLADCNRRPDDPGCLPELSDGLLVPGNVGLNPDARARRIALYHAPYHALIAAALDAFQKRGVTPAVVSVHSCTPSMNGFDRPWHIGVVWNEDGRIALPLMAALEARGDLCVGDNQPYTGKTQSGYSIPHHAEARGLPHVMLEVRQDLIAAEAGQVYWADVLIQTLGPVLRAVLAPA